MNNAHLKKLPTKDDIRRELSAQVREYLSRGETIAEIPKGESGRDCMRALPLPIISGPTRAPRTSLHQLTADIEYRRKDKSKPAVRKPKRRDTIVYDDFGEPLRIIKATD